MEYPNNTGVYQEWLKKVWHVMFENLNQSPIFKIANKEGCKTEPNEVSATGPGMETKHIYITVANVVKT